MATLRSALRVVWSPWQIRAIVFGCVMTGALGVPYVSSGWPQTAATLAGNAFLPILVVAPLLGAVVFGRETDRRLAEQAHAIGRTPNSWNRALAVASASVTAVSGVGFVLVGMVFATTPWARPRGVPGHDPVSREAVLAVASWLLASLWTSALAVRRSSGVGGMLGAAFSASYLIGTFADTQGMGVVLRVLHPALAVRIIAAGPEAYSRPAGLLAAVSIVGWTWTALHQLTRAQLTRGSLTWGRVGTRTGEVLRFRVRPRVEITHREASLSRAKWYRTAAIASAVGGFFLPSLLSHDLPPSVRPALLADRLAGNAPEQQVEEYFNAVWIGNWQGASKLTVGGDARALISAGGPTTEPLRSRPSTASFWLRNLSDGERASVGIDDGQRSVTACLIRSQGQWRIDSWSGVGICS